MSHHYRINGSMIHQFTGKPVSLIGTVSKVNAWIWHNRNERIVFRFIQQAM
jgi:hypothetical protein